jgi:uncharacterized protein YqeY
MSELIERVRADRLQARRDRDEARTLALGNLLAALETALKAGTGMLDPEQETAILRRERKRREEAAASFREGGREADALSEEAEAELIAAYMPADLGADALDALVRAAVAETGATSARDMGAVMRLVMERAGGRADGKTVSALVRDRLPAD